MKSGIADSGYPQDRIHVIPNAADLELFDVAEEVGQQFRKRFPWIQDRPLVVYAGTIGRVNGVDYLARLAAVVGRLAPQVCFLVIGQGGEARSVAQTATRLGVLGQNFYMLESLPKEEMPMVLAAATVATSLFIDLPQMWANSANKFFDALASGTPVAINYRGWQADLLADSGAGVVLDVHDLDAAAKLLVQKLQDRAWLQQAGLAARRLAEQQFSRDMLARQLEAVLLLAAQA
jgi:glycosyltransferase involved in cell wall biosynthesis